MRKVRCDSAARAVPRRAGIGVSPSTTASSISSMEMADSPGPSRSLTFRSPGPPWAHGRGEACVLVLVRGPPRSTRLPQGTAKAEAGASGTVSDDAAAACVRPDSAADEVGELGRRGEQVRRVRGGDRHPEAPARGQLGHGREDGDVLAGQLARDHGLLRRRGERVHRQQQGAAGGGPRLVESSARWDPTSAPDESGTLSPPGETASTVAASSVSVVVEVVYTVASIGPATIIGDENGVVV